jgi:c-di-GMP-binding flagellar brake protein YcgR
MNSLSTSPDDENPEEQYRVTSRTEVVAILRALAADNVLVTVFFGGPDHFVVTRLLAVNPQYEEIIFDGFSNAAEKTAIRFAPQLNVHAFHNHIKIVFDSENAEPTLFEDQPAFRMRLPKSVIRLQRRADYRAKAPVLSAAMVSLQNEALATPLAVRVSDISCGGISFALPKEKGTFNDGDVFTRCRLEMPQVGAIDVAIEIRHVARYKDGAGRAMQRYGCKFIRISGAHTTLVQRYINQIDMDRRRTAGHQ